MARQRRSVNHAAGTDLWPHAFGRPFAGHTLAAWTLRLPLCMPLRSSEEFCGRFFLTGVSTMRRVRPWLGCLGLAQRRWLDRRCGDRRALTVMITDTILGPVCAATVEELLRQRAGLPAEHPGRVVLRTRGIEAGLPLARRLAARYRGRGEPLDDLYQVAALALVKAVDGFDPDRQVAFTSYAVPTIVGMLKHHFRDTTWRVQVSRPVQELAVSLVPASARLTQQLGHSPSPASFAEQLGAAEEDVAIALNAWQSRHPESLDAMAATNGEDRRTVLDTIGAVDARLDAVTDRRTLHPLLAALPERERRIVVMRYFSDLTQAEIAVQVGLSQMHITPAGPRVDAVAHRHARRAARAIHAPGARPVRNGCIRLATTGGHGSPRPGKNSNTAPMIAVTHVLRSKNVSTVCTPNSCRARNPPSRAPAIPMAVASRKPVRFPVRCSAMKPTMAPSTIQAKTLMMLPFSWAGDPESGRPTVELSPSTDP